MSEYRSVVYNQHCPQWRETIRIKLSPQEFQHAFVQIVCVPLGATKATTPRASNDRRLVGYFPPTDVTTGVVKTEGLHDLSLYRGARNLEPIVCLRGLAASESLEKFRLTVSVSLRSQVLSQNPLVHALIHWKSQVSELADTLSKFSFVEMKDILSCFVAVAGALLEIIEEQPAMHMFAYNTLIFVFGLLLDDRSEKHLLLIESLTAACSQIAMECKEPSRLHWILVQCMGYYLHKEDSNSAAKYVRGTIRALPYLLRLIVIYQQAAEGKQSSSRCREDARASS